MFPNCLIHTIPQPCMLPTQLPNPKEYQYYCPFHTSDSLSDKEGRYLFLKGKIRGRPVTLANIYYPNSHQVTFFRKVTHLLASFREGVLIWGGNFNIALNLILDSSNGASSLPYKALRAIKTCMKELTLHDSWYTLNPHTKDYMFFSARHQCYSRLDYLFISQQDLTLLSHKTIDPMFLSDHHPISMSLLIPESSTRSLHWRLDSSLLTDPTVISKIQKCLLQYFLENDHPDTSQGNK